MGLLRSHDRGMVGCKNKKVKQFQKMSTLSFGNFSSNNNNSNMNSGLSFGNNNNNSTALSFSNTNTKGNSNMSFGNNNAGSVRPRPFSATSRIELTYYTNSTSQNMSFGGSNNTNNNMANV